MTNRTMLTEKLTSWSMHAHAFSSLEEAALFLTGEKNLCFSCVCVGVCGAWACVCVCVVVCVCVCAWACLRVSVRASVRVCFSQRFGGRCMNFYFSPILLCCLTACMFTCVRVVLRENVLDK